MKKVKKILGVFLSVAMIMGYVPEGLQFMEANVEAATNIGNPTIVSDSYMNAEQMVTWDCVWFGSYPQTEIVSNTRQCGTNGKVFEAESDCVVDSTLYKLLQNATYNGNGDTTINGIKYQRALKEDVAQAINSDGYYDWDDSIIYHYFRYEPIKWRVLNIKSGKALLLADKVLDNKKHYPENTLTTWEKSTIRSWLNGYDSSENSGGTTYSKKNFIKSAFTSSEQEAIVRTSIDNSSTGPYSTMYGGNDTMDQVFLLSSYDLYNTNTALSYGFTLSSSIHDEARKCISSTYAKAMGTFSYIWEDEIGNCQWWLRSPGDSTINSAFVNSVGYIQVSGSNTSSYYCNGIRPALYLDLLASDLYTYAGTVCSDGTMNQQSTYTVTYDANGGIGAPLAQSGTVSGSSSSCKFIISNTIPTRDGYTFLGWSKSSSAMAASYSSGGNITVSSSTTLYAVWKENEETITEINISDCSIEVESNLIYTGSPLEPKVTVQYDGNTLVNGRDYSLQYQNNTEVGSGSVTITGQGDYVGSITKNFVIKEAEQTSTKLVSDCELSLTKSSLPYNGKTQTPEVTVKDGDTVLKKDTDYTVSSEEAIDVGTYTITVKGKGDYSGSKDLTFEILPINPVLEFETSEVTKTTEDATFTNSLDAVTDGTIKYSSDDTSVATVNTSTGKVTIIGIGTTVIRVTSSVGKNYLAGAASYTLTVTDSAKLVSDCEISLTKSNLPYNGKTQTPEVTAKDGDTVLEKDTDYTVSSEEAIDVGTYTITVKGKGDYSGSKDLTFEILPINPVLEFETSEVTKTTEDATFTNSLDAVTDGTIKYSSDDTSVATVNTSTGKVTIIGIGTTVIRVTSSVGKNYLAGAASYTLTVTDSAKLVSDCEISLTKSNLSYNGKTQTPEVTVKDGDTVLEKDTDYTVSGEEAIDAGTYTITIKGKGDYSGSKDLTFEILPINPVLEFETSEVTKTTEDATFTNSLDAVTDGTIKYSSDDTSVATVNASTGKVTIVGTGTTVIRAISAAGKNYKAGEASYTFTVKEKEAPLSLSLENLSYSFGNTASSFKYPERYIYPLNIYEMIFGKTTKASFWYDRDLDITGGIWRGNCAGFSGTSALLMDPSSGIAVKDFDSSATSIGQLNSKSKSSSQGMDVTGFIESMQIAQHTQLFSNEISKNRIYTSKHLNKRLKNLNGLYQTVRKETEAGRPVILALYQTGAHAVLAYEVKEMSDTESQIMLYDSNWPEKERALTLKKDAEGNFMEWVYEIGGSYGTWGTDYRNSSISYVPYSVIKEIWETKGRLKENENVLSINSGSVAIYTSGDKPVATVTQGELSTTIDDIHVIDYLSLERADSDTLLLSVPVDVYTFKNLDKSVEEFEVSVANTNLGASASTTAESITMAVDDSCNLNAVYIDAGENDEYSITLNSSFTYDEDNVVVTGKGNGEIMEVSQTKGSININNCQITSISINGKEIDKYQINASAGVGGKITPDGETVVTKGESVSYKIEALSGYMISNVFVDGRSVGAVSTYDFDNVAADHEIKAEFKKKNGPAASVKKKANQITAKNVSLTYSNKAQSFYVKAAVKGNAKLIYRSDNPSVKVASNGKVTVAKRFVGKAFIRIKSAATDSYSEASKVITVIVKPTGTVIKTLKKKSSGKMMVTWKKNSTVTGYQISYSTSAAFKNAKTVTIKNKKVATTVLKKPNKNKKYYVRIRTYKVVGGKKYYSVWSKRKKG